MNKKGIELSVNFLVVIIISIDIIGFSVYILTTVVGRAGELSRMTQEDLNKRIETLQCTGIVCFAVNYKEIKRGEFDIFGLKIFNTGAEAEFSLDIAPVKPGLSFVPESGETFRIGGNEEKRIGIGIEVPKNATSGIYIFNIGVTRTSIAEGTTEEYPPKQQIRIEVP